MDVVFIFRSADLLEECQGRDVCLSTAVLSWDYFATLRYVNRWTKDFLFINRKSLVESLWLNCEESSICGIYLHYRTEVFQVNVLVRVVTLRWWTSAQVLKVDKIYRAVCIFIWLSSRRQTSKEDTCKTETTFFVTNATLTFTQMISRFFRDMLHY